LGESLDGNLTPSRKDAKKEKPQEADFAPSPPLAMSAKGTKCAKKGREAWDNLAWQTGWKNGAIGGALHSALQLTCVSTPGTFLDMAFGTTRRPGETCG
jgi:hypothetical protein